VTARFPDDQAEIVFSDVLVEQLADLAEHDQIDVLAEVHRLCEQPEGRHRLAAPLAGWNTLVVRSKRFRVVYRASWHTSVGLIEVLCLGPRRESEVYDTAVALARSGILDVDEVTQLWEALALMDLVPEAIGLDGWDFQPPPARDGMVRAAVAAGVLPEDVASLLSLDELQAAMTSGWSSTGAPDPHEALRAALERARSRIAFPGLGVVLGRGGPRCGLVMPRAGARCIRARGHPGAHRSR
jgi:hypothetical protein